MTRITARAKIYTRSHAQKPGEVVGGAVRVGAGAVERQVDVHAHRARARHRDARGPQRRDRVRGHAAAAGGRAVGGEGPGERHALEGGGSLIPFTRFLLLGLPTNKKPPKPY